MTKRQWLRVSSTAASDVGLVREGNEDDYFVGDTVVAVADGMGGHVAGEVAARTALEPLAALDGKVFASSDEAEEALAEAVRVANRLVVEKAEADPELQGMGTTLTAGMVRDGRLHVAHVGDSRAYLLRVDEPMTQLTTDHTLVERLVREGRLSRHEAALHPQRNFITRAVGNEPDVVVDSLPPLTLQPGDQVLLCSDGLTGPVSDADISAVLNAGQDGPTTVRRLIAEANNAGGPDNITIVLLRISGAPGPEDAPATADQLRRIRTREDAKAEDWASKMGQLGAPQGAVQREDTADRASGGRGRRVFAGLLGALLLIGVVGGGTLLLLSRAYFVGEHDGKLAVFQGVPQEVGSVPLYRVIDGEITDLDIDAFPDWRQERIQQGITASTILEARRRIDELASTIVRDPVEPGNGRDARDEPAGNTRPGTSEDGTED